jgi:glyoxylase-like metal-dependent hydrolase (beta-lactamase superfamily II)
MTYQIHRLNFGSVVIDAAMQIRGRAPGTTVAVPAQGYLIMGGDAPVLVDAGYRDPSVLGSGGVVEDGQGFAEQLALHGVRPGDLGCVIMTHLHRDHAGHLYEVPMNVPVVVNRSEMSCAFSGLQGLAYARADLVHLVDRMYTPGALHYLDLDYSGPVEVLPGISCHATGGHTAGSMSIVVDTAEGQACLCGDLIYDVEAALLAQPGVTPAAGVQSCFFGHQEPAVTNNFTVSVLQELGALKRLAKYRFVLPAHDAPGVLERGQLTGRINGPVIPGPVTPVTPRAKGASA